mgnify:CR=1 FL=1
MASAKYPKGMQKFLEGGINWGSDNIKVVLVDLADYTYVSTHEFLSSVPVGARVATFGNLTGKNATNGVATAANISVAATGDQSEALIVYKDTGDAATSPLICFIDTASSGFPFTPNSGLCEITWDTGSNGIFAI